MVTILWRVRVLVPLNTSDRDSLVMKVTDFWSVCHEFEPSTTEEPPCNGECTLNLSSNVLPLVWSGSFERGVPVQVSSSSLDHGSNLQGSLPKDLE
ncbi:hypothetical protein TNCV_2623451 [Trichonephila clavipes]|nr:hypothetical protein TNCV_2623451 [Trichonephila clavipes]